MNRYFVMGSRINGVHHISLITFLEKYKKCNNQ